MTKDFNEARKPHESFQNKIHFKFRIFKTHELLKDILQQHVKKQNEIKMQ